MPVRLVRDGCLGCAVLTRLQTADRIDWYCWHRQLLPPFVLRVRGNSRPNPTDYAGLDSKHHLVTEAQGILPAAILTGANHNDVT